ncbi:MAG: glycosyl transferase family 8 [Sphingomonas bacterium]|nr:glycosyl transferase family 8 [Sphingomonas bacterium]
MRIACAFSTDDNYAEHLAVAITSLLQSNRAHQIDLHIVHHGVSPESLSRLAQVVAAHDHATVQFHTFDTTPYRHFRLDNHITLASYFRLFLSDVLPAGIDRILFLDADIVVLDDIGPLWATPLDGALIGAVPDPFAGGNNARLGLPADHVYFNAGVLLIDLAGWRAEALLPRFVSYVERNHAILSYHDQDTLNAVLLGRIAYLSILWNFQARTRWRDAAALPMPRDAFERIRRHPAIVHYTTRRKPWNYADKVPFEAHYLRYRAGTPWKALRPKRTPSAFLKRHLRGPINLYLRLKHGA